MYVGDEHLFVVSVSSAFIAVLEWVAQVKAQPQHQARAEDGQDMVLGVPCDWHGERGSDRVEHM